jgi:hypothetical protein
MFFIVAFLDLLVPINLYRIVGELLRLVVDQVCTLQVLSNQQSKIVRL